MADGGLLPRRSFRREARACRIYGVAKAAGWCLTVADINRVTGIHRRTIISIIKERDWKLEDTDDRREFSNEPRPLYELIR